MINSVRPVTYRSIPFRVHEDSIFDVFFWWLRYLALGSTANLVLEDTVERIYHKDVFAEQWVGLFLIRGENVVLLGEVVSTAKSLPSWALRALSQILISSFYFLGS